MSRSCAIVLALCGLVAVTTVPGSAAQAYDGSAVASSGGWDALGGLYALLAQHDALGGHALARKSVRSPSRRLRFGRRSDPDMPPQAPLDEVLAIRDERSPARLRFGRRSDESAAPHDLSQQLDEILREERSPARLRFGRRSEENAVAHQLPQELEDMLTVRDERSPARLRFGRRSDELTFPHVFPQELHEASEDMSRDVRAPARLRFGRRSDEHAVPHIIPQEEQDRAVRAPSMRLRFGRRSDNNMFVMPFESTVPKEVKASGSVEDDRQD